MATKKREGKGLKVVHDRTNEVRKDYEQEMTLQSKAGDDSSEQKT